MIHNQTAMHTTTLLAGYNEATKELLETVASFREDQFNTVPYPGGWTAAQVTEHLLIAASGIPDILKGPTESAERAPDEKVAAISAVFLDFTAKFKSPDFVLPSDEPQEREQLYRVYRQVKDEIAEIAAIADLTALCTSEPFPQLGELTGLEWIWFDYCHTKRHTLQLKKIQAHLTGTIPRTEHF